MFASGPTHIDTIGGGNLLPTGSKVFEPREVIIGEEARIRTIDLESEERDPTVEKSHRELSGKRFTTEAKRIEGLIAIPRFRDFAHGISVSVSVRSVTLW